MDYSLRGLTRETISYMSLPGRVLHGKYCVANYSRSPAVVCAFLFRMFLFFDKKPRTHSSLIYYFIRCIMYYVLYYYTILNKIRFFHHDSILFSFHLSKYGWFYVTFVALIHICIIFIFQRNPLLPKLYGSFLRSFIQYF